jgi:hypothetical protein
VTLLLFATGAFSKGGCVQSAGRDVERHRKAGVAWSRLGLAWPGKSYIRCPLLSPPSHPDSYTTSTSNPTTAPSDIIHFHPKPSTYITSQSSPCARPNSTWYVKHLALLSTTDASTLAHTLLPCHSLHRVNFITTSPASTSIKALPWLDILS